MKSLKTQYSKRSSLVKISLTCHSDRLPDFGPLWLQGCMIRAELGLSVRKILCDQLRVSHDYLDQRISTIFLDGKPVDDVDSTVIGVGSVLALSAAMPGFVGAALRKGGFYSVMRREISHMVDQQTQLKAEGLFTLKLYNQVARELGPFLLKLGVWLESKDLENFLTSRPPDLWARCTKLEVDDSEVDLGIFVNNWVWLKKYALVHLTFKPAG